MNSLYTQFQKVKDTFKRQPMPSKEDRVEKLTALKSALINHKEEIFGALHQDFGHRSIQDTVLEFLPCINNIDYTIKELDNWLKPSHRNVGVLLDGYSDAKVIYQPKGVVGIISTWNAPIMVTVNPLSTVIAAGNVAMIKMSEFTPHFNTVLKIILAEVFAENEVVIIEGEADIAAEFSALPFDHLLFTGSTTVGKLVMKAASQNLTPVTLELGGKSPVLIDDTQTIESIVERIIIGKSANNGQLCIAPDYVMLPTSRLHKFISEYKKQYSIYITDGVDSDELTSVVNQRHYQRLKNVIEDAENRKAIIEPCHEKAMDDQKHRMVTHLVINPPYDSLILQDEIFGPLLPIITYDHIDSAIDYVSSKPKPLAFYLFTENEELKQKIQSTIHSGGMCINDTIFHAAVDDAPFGGVGASGIGHYHGIEGFLTFSHAKTILETKESYPIKHLFQPGENELKNTLFQLIEKC